MACSIQIKTEEFLREEGIVDKDNTILNLEKVDRYIDSLTNLAYYKYGVGTSNSNLFTIKDNKLLPNERLFDLLEESTFYHDVEDIFVNNKNIKDIIDESEKEEKFTIKEEESEQPDAFERKKVKLDTLEDRIDFTLDKVKESIRFNIIRLSAIVKNPKANEDVKKYSEEKRETLKELLENIKEQKDGINAKGITSFVNNMMSALNSLDQSLLKVDLTNPKQAKFLLENYDNYLSSFSVAQDVKDLIAEFRTNKTQTYLSQEELNDLRRKIDSAIGSFESVSKNMINTKKEYFKEQLKDIKYFPGVMAKHRNRLSTEFNKKRLRGDKQEYINKRLAPGSREWDAIQEDLEKAVVNLLENPIFDIKSADTWATSPSNISNGLFQIFHSMLLEIDNKRIEMDRQQDQVALKIFEDLRKEKGSINVNKLYKNIVEKDKNGKVWLKGEYNSNFIIEVTQKIRDIRNAYREKINEATDNAVKIGAIVGHHSEDYIKAEKKVEDIIEERDKKINTILRNNTIEKEDGKRVPNAKWRNNLSHLSPAEKNALEYYKSIIDKGHKADYNQSLRQYSYGGLFYNTPFITKSSLERYYDGDIKGGILEKWNYLNENRADDIEYTNTQVGIDGEVRKELRLHYRENPLFKNKDQSMDLATMFRLENKNVNLFLDVNKAANYINGATAFMALSFNFASGTANVVNANAQMFLETVIKGRTFKAKNIAKAQKIYFTPSVFTDTLKDNIRGINRGYVNQISEIFNTRGLYSISNSNFLQANLAKKGLDLKSLQVFQDSGEHWIQSVLTMALLDNIKVMNSNSKFIDVNGNETTFKKAASLLDMYKVNPKTGLVSLDKNVVYTTHTPSLQYYEGGKELIDKLIRKKIDDSIGNYTETQQADGFRHYLYKIGMLFRKYLVPMGQARLLGIESSYIAKDKLREDQTRFSHALQEFEEGTYTTLIRYGWNSLKTLKREILTRENWDNLSDYEKHNIKRAAVELAMTFVILPNAIKLMAMGAASADEDEEKAWYFLMYQTRRNITELQAYINPRETLKMLKSPIPSVRFLESTIDVLYNTATFNFFEEDARGNNVWLKNVNKFNPGRHFFKDFEKTFQWQDNRSMF